MIELQYLTLTIVFVYLLITLGEWVSFDRLILLADVYTYLIGFTAFCTYIKAIKYLTLNPHVAELASTMKISGKGYYFNQSNFLL